MGTGLYRGYAVRYRLQGVDGELAGALEFDDPQAPIHTFMVSDPNAPMEEMVLAEGGRLLFRIKSYNRLHNTIAIINGRTAT